MFTLVDLQQTLSNCKLAHYLNTSSRILEGYLIVIAFAFECSFCSDLTDD